MKLSDGPVLYENIIHKSITDNFSLNKVLFCNLCCRNAYSYLFSDGRGTISYYVHICLSYCVKRRGVVPAAHLASCFTYVANLLRSQKQEKNDGIVPHR
jgi:hypothetical protein